MKESPIIFSTKMVQAILNGRKTQTRRIKKGDGCPYGKVGDLLYVRECWAPDCDEILYKADLHEDEGEEIKWKPSIHMPKKHARIWLEITGIRVEKLQDITPEDALCEGIGLHEYPVVEFKYLWNSINEKRGYDWASNPFVWVVEFKKDILRNLPDDKFFNA